MFLNGLFEPHLGSVPRYWYIQIQPHIIVYVSIVLLNTLLPRSLYRVYASFVLPLILFKTRSTSWTYWFAQSHPRIHTSRKNKEARRRVRLICLALLILSLSLSVLSVSLPCLSLLLSLKAIHTTHSGFGHPLIWFRDINVKALCILPNPRAKPSFLFPNGWIQAPHLLIQPSLLASTVRSHPLSLSLSLFLSLSLSLARSPLPFGGGYIRYNQFNFMQPGQTPRGHKYTHFLIHSTPGKAHPPQPRAALGPLALNY